MLIRIHRVFRGGKDERQNLTPKKNERDDLKFATHTGPSHPYG